MRDAAARSGHDLQAISSFRDFERQVVLWNRKWRGERPLHDRSGAVLEYGTLTEPQRVDAILCWSAIPGGSRHHWGSDIDVVDAAAMPEGYQPQLLPGEYAAGGVFERLTLWLDRHMHRFGFHRPYATDRGGAGIERWHLSYAPVARQAIEATLAAGAEAGDRGERDARQGAGARAPAGDLHAVHPGRRRSAWLTGRSRS